MPKLSDFFNKSSKPSKKAAKEAPKKGKMTIKLAMPDDFGSSSQFAATAA